MKTFPTILFLTVFAINATFAQKFEKAVFKGSSGDELRYALLKPTKVNRSEKYPLVITLHGAGGRGIQNWVPRCYANTVLSKPDMQKEYPSFVVAPATEKGETWWDSPGLRGKGRLADVLDLIEHLLDELPIDKDRIYVTGQSMGGFGSFGAIIERPDLFAAAAPVCGGHDPKNGKKIADIPIWAFHGAKDTTVPVRYSQDMIAAIKKAGGKPKYTEYPNTKHNAWTKAYEDKKLWKWLFDQKRSAK